MDIPEGSVISLPPALLEDLAPVLLASGTPPTENAKKLPPDQISRVIGPAFIGYAEVVTGSPLHPVQLLGPKEAADIALLQEACDATEWEHGGSSLEEADAICGVFAGDTLAALAGYKIWDGTIAHISVVTHPEHRGMGYGRSSVAFLARHA
ncbi:MAG: GNAT family N-acetyltransferase, partial [Roseimicrobium sp.]